MVDREKGQMEANEGTWLQKTGRGCAGRKRGRKMREVWIQAQRMRAVKRRSELLADGRVVSEGKERG